MSDANSFLAQLCRVGDFFLRDKFEKRFVVETGDDNRIAAAQDRMNGSYSIGICRLCTSSNQSLHPTGATGDKDQVNIKSVFGKKIQVFCRPDCQLATTRPRMTMSKVRLGKTEPWKADKQNSR